MKRRQKVLNKRSFYSSLYEIDNLQWYYSSAYRYAFSEFFFFLDNIPRIKFTILNEDSIREIRNLL